jgi:hypothetical protein
VEARTTMTIPKSKACFMFHPSWRPKVSGGGCSTATTLIGVAEAIRSGDARQSIEDDGEE